MAGSTINGNVGGAAASGTLVQCVDNRNPNNAFIAIADASGNFSFTGLIQARYVISAQSSGNVYYHPVHVVTDGTSTFGGINLNPTALSAANAPVQAGNF